MLFSSDPLVIREVLHKFIFVLRGPPPPVRGGVCEAPAGVLARPIAGPGLRLVASPVSDDEVEDGEAGDTEGEKYQGEEQRENRPAMMVIVSISVHKEGLASPGLISDNGGGVEDHALLVSLHLVEAEVSTDVVVAVCRDLGEDGLQLSVEDGPARAGGDGEATAVVVYLEWWLVRQGHGHRDRAGGDHAGGEAGGDGECDVVTGGDSGDVALQGRDPHLGLGLGGRPVWRDGPGAAWDDLFPVLEGQTEDVGPV